MSYSNRRAHRPDPTVAPVVIDPRTGEVSMRMPWVTPSPYQEAKLAARKELKDRKRRAKKLGIRL